MTGTIKTLNKERRFGFIMGADGLDYFFHESALKNVKFEELAKGHEVEFEDVETDKGLRAEDVYV